MIINQQRVKYIALAQRVLAVAVASLDVKDWSAYVDAVYGINHDHEWQNVAEQGAKLSQDVATLLFPSFAIEYTWRE